MDMQEELIPRTLLPKYAGGRMPPLVDLEHPERGLIDADLLRVYYSGMLSRYALPLGILLAALNQASLERKWQKGDDTLNLQWTKDDWTPFCKALRETDTGNEICRKCDKRWAITADSQGKVIAYMCDSGLVDFAVPISVKEQVIAVIFCGQFKPQAGAIWNPEFIAYKGYFRPSLASGQEGADAWAVSQLRIQDVIARIAEKETGELPPDLVKGNVLAAEISPEKVQETQEVLAGTAKQLSSLATVTYELEKSKIVGWLRNEVTHALEALGDEPQDTIAVWQRLSLGLQEAIDYFGLDYALMLSCYDGGSERIKLVCQAGLSEDSFPIGGQRSIAPESATRVNSLVCGLEEPQAVVLREYRDFPFFDRLHRLHKQGKRVLAARIQAHAEATPLLMLMGRFKRDVTMDRFLPDDRQALEQIIEGIELVADIVLLVDQLSETASKQTSFLEDVAHDIRTPIQNILLDARALARGLASPEMAKDLAGKLAAQVWRLHIMSQRVWTSVEIEQGSFDPEETEDVDVYETLTECRNSLVDLAARREIAIWIDPMFREWQDRRVKIRVNRTLFFQAVLNLMDNAVKYSHPRTEVRIYGRSTPSQIVINFTNRGILIREEEEEKIFERYYRTTEARRHRLEGTGIGLHIVRTFVDYYGDIEVRSNPIGGTGDYLTEFKLVIPRRESRRV
jgi:signal transduction histidine kinase